MSTKRLAKRVLLVGWDGADWRVIHPLLDAGEMPHLERLVDQGVMGKLETVQPGSGPAVWTSLATGAWTGTHGINTFGIHSHGERFEEAPRLNPSIFPEFVDRAPAYLNQLCRAEYIWQAAERAGKHCILVNWPGGWPPGRV